MEAMKVYGDLTVAEVNIVLNALAQRPFVEVADVIAKIKVSADERLNNMSQMAQAMNAVASEKSEDE